jgi:hypothetical protein
MMEAELSALIPDYEPTLVKAAQVRRPEPLSGNVYPFEEAREDRSPKQETSTGSVSQTREESPKASGLDNPFQEFSTAIHRHPQHFPPDFPTGIPLIS